MSKSTGDIDWLPILRRRAAGLPDEEGIEIEEVPVVVGIFDRKPKNPEDFASGEEKKPSAEPDAELIRLLEGLLERARAGELVGVLGIGLKDDRHNFEWFRTASMNEDSTSVLGQLEIIKHWIATEELEDALGVNDEIAELEGDE